MPPVGYEPTVSAGERPQTYALDRAATGTGMMMMMIIIIIIIMYFNNNFNVKCWVSYGLKLSGQLEIRITRVRIIEEPLYFLIFVTSGI